MEEDEGNAPRLFEAVCTHCGWTTVVGPFPATTSQHAVTTTRRMLCRVCNTASVAGPLPFPADARPRFAWERTG